MNLALEYWEFQKSIADNLTSGHYYLLDCDCEAVLTDITEENISGFETLAEAVAALEDARNKMWPPDFENLEIWIGKWDEKFEEMTHAEIE